MARRNLALPEIEQDDPNQLARLLLGQDDMDMTESDPWNAGFARPGPQPGMEDTAAPQVVPQPGGQWSSWVQDPANQSFLINTGLQLMSGGWGNTGNQVARALAAGFQGAHATQAEGIQAQAQAQGPGGVRAGRRVGRPQGPVQAPADSRAEAERAQLSEVAAFLQRTDLTEAEWTQQAQEGGLIHRAFGPGQPFQNKEQLLLRVQNRLHQLPRRGGTVSSEELLRLGKSTAPQDLADFEILARQVLGNPGVGHRWIVTPDGRFDRQALTSAPRGGAGGSPTARSALAAMQQGVTALDDIQAALSTTNPAERAAGHITGMGVWGTVEPQLNLVSRALMHGLSGAQVSIPETEAYLRAFMPNPLRLSDWTLDRVNYRLNHARWLLLSMLQAQGQRMDPGLILQVRNSMRAQLGQPALTMEQHLQEMQRYGAPSANPTAQQPAPAPQVPPVQPQTPPVQPAPAPAVPPGHLRPPAAPKADPQQGMPTFTPRPDWAIDPPANAPARPGENFFWHGQWQAWVREVQ